ncbi:MarR family winged helix-turn-helix transcriptional regulator [[Clostridium] symbiosum]|nr:MarR family winged helix-turn-helix transcriptional regulator [[Clostridium] symbiosum]
MDKVYRRFYQHELAEYQFTPNEIAVILFLYNNAPDLDTATDIVRCKGISKGLVARSVDSLCREGYLTAVREPADRRIMHLKLSEKSRPITERIAVKQKELAGKIECGITPEELRITSATLDKLLINTEQLLKGKENHAE